MKEYMEIILSNGYSVKVSPEDYDYINQWKWKIHVGGYACRSAGSPKQGYRCILMHREIAKTPDGLETDHINGNKLDNRRCNLRNVTRSENEFYKRPDSRNTSGKRGICWDKNRNKWLVRISHKHIGRFTTFTEAISARQKAIEQYEAIIHTN